MTDGQRSSRLGGFAYKRLYTKNTSTMLEYDSAGEIVCCEHMDGEEGWRDRGASHPVPARERHGPSNLKSKGKLEKYINTRSLGALRAPDF